MAGWPTQPPADVLGERNLRIFWELVRPPRLELGTPGLEGPPSERLYQDGYLRAAPSSPKFAKSGHIVARKRARPPDPHNRTGYRQFLRFGDDATILQCPDPRRRSTRLGNCCLRFARGSSKRFAMSARRYSTTSGMRSVSRSPTDSRRPIWWHSLPVATLFQTTAAEDLFTGRCARPSRAGRDAGISTRLG